ncbi:MAG: hypothetical protein U0269_00340 [Polyangiales bacterium]
MCALSLSACAPHVSLPAALPRTAPTQARLAQYNALRPMQTMTVVTVGNNGGSSMATQTMLANGTNVYYSEDLLPLVGPNSQSWRHTETAQTLESVSTWTTVGGVLLAGAGAALIVLGPSSLRWNVDTTITVGLGFLIPAALSALTGGITRYVAGWQRRDAFLAFDNDFRGNLGLCLTGTGFADCAPTPLPINGGAAQLPPSPPLSAVRGVAPLRF